LRKDISIGIVEDDAEVRGAYSDLMRSYGFATEAYNSAEDFLADNGQSKVDCLILDQRLPGMNGLELQKQLLVKGSKIPVLFVTSDERPVLREQALAFGARQFVNKPATAEALMKAVINAVS
jgi:FixJ family two-component response regulator